jgi:NADP-dependent aldehyde dehydrogenase
VRDSVAVGVVAVFGAGNFPLAFGALGTDTAAALAAGCPVVVKAHPGHPETSELCVRAAHAALARRDLRAALAVLHGGADFGVALVSRPGVAAVAFTGSPVAGRALIDAAARRPAPIPVYAEMGSVNPVLVTESAAARRGEALAAQLTASVLGSAGQLCTKPGVLLAPQGAAGDAFVAALEREIAAGGPFTLLNDHTARRFSERLAELDAEARVRTLVPHSGDGPALFELDAGDDPAETARAVGEEAFGPAAIVVRYRDLAQVERLQAALGGQLTFTIFGEEEDAAAISGVLAVARRAAGRIVWNDVPTGVAVAAAMHHGGPWPASNSPLGSVGPEAIWRFRRPLTWQGFPAGLRPPGSMDFPGIELA